MPSIHFQTFVCSCGVELHATVGGPVAFGRLNDAQWRTLCNNKKDGPEPCNSLAAAIKRQWRAGENPHKRKDM
jgi:uncharacterized protein YgfB (UPF0149 family)